jgi:hypothetical protein
MLTIDEAAIIIGAILVLMIWTYLWRANPVYFYGTAACVGATMGHFFVSAMYSLQEIAWNRVQVDYWVIIPIILGFMLFARFRREYSWVSTTAISVIAGVSLGLLVAGGIQTDIFNQLNVVVALNFATADAYVIFSNIVTFLCAFAVISFFLFQRRLASTGTVRYLSYVGRVLMLGAGGVSFATGYAFRQTMALNALQPFVATYPGQVAFPIVGAMVLIALWWERSH